MSKQEIFERDEDIREELIQAAKEIGRLELKERLVKLDEARAKRRYLSMVVIAAVLVVTVLVSVLLLLKPPSTEKIYADAYMKFPNKVVAITRGDAKEKDLKKAMLAYENGDYQGLLSEFDTLEEAHPELSIYKGIVLMEQLEYERAIQELKQVHEDRNSSFNEDASWYLALAYLKVQDLAEARRIMTQLSKKSAKYQEKSSLILNKL